MTTSARRVPVGPLTAGEAREHAAWSQALNGPARLAPDAHYRAACRVVAKALASISPDRLSAMAADAVGYSLRSEAQPMDWAEIVVLVVELRDALGAAGHG